jgi:hypothetical protein
MLLGVCQKGHFIVQCYHVGEYSSLTYRKVRYTINIPANLIFCKPAFHKARILKIQLLITITDISPCLIVSDKKCGHYCKKCSIINIDFLDELDRCMFSPINSGFLEENLQLMHITITVFYK